MAPLSERSRRRLLRLAGNGAAHQWSADRDIDWRRSVSLPEWITTAEVRFALSQLFHGEVATGRLCHRLLDDAASPEARRCLELQIGDEARHAQVYDRYLERLGGVAPIDARLFQALDDACHGPAGNLGAMLAFHVVVEGEVLRLQDSLTRFLGCPLLRQINRRIAQDEARHVAFGRIHLTEALAQLPDRDRREILGWLQGLWSRSAKATLKASAGRSFLVRQFLSLWLERGWDRHQRALAEIGLAPRRLWFAAR